MSYRYMSLQELSTLHNRGREAIIIFGVHTNDLDEYINNCMITLQNSGFNIHILNNARIIKGKNKTRTIILCIRHNAEMSKEDINSFIKWKNEMKNVCTLEEFMNNSYISGEEKERRKILKNKIKEYSIIQLEGLDRQVNSSKTLNISRDELMIKGLYDNNIENLLTNIIKYMYTNRKFFVHTVKFLNKENNRVDIKVNVEPTLTSVKFTYEINC